jgi:hypothetical protein
VIEETESFGYLALFHDDKRGFKSVALAGSLEQLERMLSEETRNDAEPQLGASSTSEKTIEEGLDRRASELINQFSEALTSIRSMIAFTGMVMPLARTVFIEGRLKEFAENNLKNIKSDARVVVYSYDRNQFVDVKKLIGEYLELVNGHAALPKAILLSLVSTFDSFFAEIIRFFLSVHPERYTSSDRQISMKEVLTKKSIEEVIEHIIGEEINDLMRGSHTEQVKFVEEILKVKIIGHYERWPNFVEIFERRNLVAHGNLIVNTTYLKRCKEAKLTDIDKFEIGATLTLGPGYLNKALDILIEFGVLLVFTLWKKHIPDSDEKAFEHLGRVAYDFIVKKRPRLAKNLLEFALYKQNKTCSEKIRKMMTINLANANKKLKKDDECKRILDGTDWSAANNEFQICIASLRGDTRRVVELMPSVAASGVVTASEFREWPVFDWIREDPVIIEAFERVYNEPMRKNLQETVFTENVGQATKIDADAAAAKSETIGNPPP